jgi:hypothetical protein
VRREVCACERTSSRELSLSDANNRRSRCALLRGWPVLSLAFLSWLDTTSWTRDGRNLLWGEFFSHDRGTIPRTCAGVGTLAHMRFQQ